MMELFCKKQKKKNKPEKNKVKLFYVWNIENKR